MKTIKNRSADGITESEMYYDPDEDRLTVRHTQDVEPLLDMNKREYAEHDGKYRSETMNKVASIPMHIVLKWKQEGLDIFDPSPETQKKLLKKLNDPEYRYLRTRPGRL